MSYANFHEKARVVFLMLNAHGCQKPDRLKIVMFCSLSADLSIKTHIPM